MFQITLLNTEYLHKVYKRGGDTDYLLSKVPAFLETNLRVSGLYVAKTFSSNISALGCLDDVCDNNHADLSELLSNVSFGQWLRTVDTNYSSFILNGRNPSSFTVAETGGVYRALLNTTVLGSDLTSKGADGVALNAQCREWARSVCFGGLSVQVSSANSSVCGIAHLFRECGPDSVVNVSVVREMMLSAFCPKDGSMWCLDLAAFDDQTLSAYFAALRDFVMIHLLKVIHHYVLAQGNRDLVMTRSQSDLALGYNVTDDVDSANAWRHVQGLLAEGWVKSASSEGVMWRVDTCLQDRDMNNNMKVRGGWIN